ncbi:hypothetical protein CMUS01_15821 [Colletotrichum musicola]|uniref:Uncharacterized protein n=1 Tax=Colletotrichum musicola TaxID=2175873 RepID=A0A8H6ITV5_9PEZI|nr:hypothetical protein CMUS01_15821 [Colletotrichum musicola]
MGTPRNGDNLRDQINAFAAEIDQRRETLDEYLATIYSRLLEFEASLVDDPCDVRRLLPDGVVNTILLALPADTFRIRRNRRNINGKLCKIAEASDTIQLLCEHASDRRAGRGPRQLPVQNYKAVAIVQGDVTEAIKTAQANHASSCHTPASVSAAASASAFGEEQGRGSVPRSESPSPPARPPLSPIVAPPNNTEPEPLVEQESEVHPEDASELFGDNFGANNWDSDGDDFDRQLPPPEATHPPMSRLTASRGTKRSRTDFEPGELIRNLVERGTAVQRDWMDRSFRDLQTILGPSISYVGSDGVTMLTSEGSPPHFQLVGPILESTRLLVLVDVGNSSWAVMVVEISNQGAHRASLIDPRPSEQNLKAARQLFDTFVDHILKSTPPERRMLRSALTPPQESQEDNGVVLFATVLAMVSVLGVSIDDWQSLCPTEVHVPAFQPYAPPPPPAEQDGNDADAAPDDPIRALTDTRTHWEAWFKAQQATIVSSLEQQRAEITPVHEGALTAVDALAELIPRAEGRLKDLHRSRRQGTPQTAVCWFKQQFFAIPSVQLREFWSCRRDGGCGHNRRRVAVAGAGPEHGNHQHHHPEDDTHADANHPQHQFATLALPLVANPDSSRARRLNLCLYCDHVLSSGTTIYVAADSIYQTPYPYSGIPARPRGNVSLATPDQLYQHRRGGSDDDGDGSCAYEDVDVHVDMNVETEQAFNTTSPTKNPADDAPSRGTPSLHDATPPSWIARHAVVVAFLILGIVVVLRLVAYPPPISRSNRHATRHYKALAEYRSTVEGLWAVPRAMFVGDWGMSDWFRGPAGLEPVAMRELVRAFADVQQDLEGTRLALGEATSRVPTETLMLLIMALEMNYTATRWALGRSKQAETMAMPGPAGLRDWLPWLAPEPDASRTRESFDTQSRILCGITGIHTQLSSFSGLMRRARWTADTEVVPLLSASSDARLAGNRLAAVAPSGRERAGLVQAGRDVTTHMCRFQNALQALEDMVMTLPIIVTAAGEADPVRPKVSATRRRPFTWDAIRDYIRPQEFLIPRPEAISAAVNTLTGDREAIIDARQRRYAAMRQGSEAKMERKRLATIKIVNMLHGKATGDVAGAGGWRAL